MACRGVCTSGSRSMLPRPRSAGTNIPQYSQTRIARPALMPPPPPTSRIPTRPRSALPMAVRRPSQRAPPRQQAPPRAQPVQRRPPSGIPVPSRGQGVSRIPCPRRVGLAQPSVTINAPRPGISGNDININIRLSLEAPVENTQDPEEAELEEFERMERRCEMECSLAQIFDAVPMTPPNQTGRYGRPHHNLFDSRRQLGYDSARGTRRQDQRFDNAVANASFAGADINAYSPPPFETPPSYNIDAEWSGVGQEGSMIMDESSNYDMSLFNRGMIEGAFDNSGWNQFVEGAMGGYDMQHEDHDYAQSPGRCC